MKVLITGGAGFIGSHLAEQFLRSGDTVHIIDNLNDFYDPAIKRNNLDAVKAAGPVDHLIADIADEKLVVPYVLDSRPDIIVHLAARAGVRPSLRDPLLYVDTNVRGTAVLLEAARLAGVRRFIFASSSSVYGATNRVPFSEADETLLPVSPYAATKLAGEKLCYTYSHLYNLPVACLRFFTVYGPRQRPDLAIRKFIDLMLRGQPITLYGDGSTSRDYTFVEDTVSGILASCHHNSLYDIFNLGNSSPVSLRILVSTLEELLQTRAEIRWEPDQPGDVPITFADISKARANLGYEPRTPLADGLRRFIEWYRADDCHKQPSQ
jgi:UDP-glucuronate 4-epimerase